MNGEQIPLPVTPPHTESFPVIRVDPKFLNKPDKLGAPGFGWRTWCSDMRSWLVAIDVRFRKWLDEAEVRAVPFRMDGVLESTAQGSSVLYAILKSYTQDADASIVNESEEMNGFEAWRR